MDYTRTSLIPISMRSRLLGTCLIAFPTHARALSMSKQGCKLFKQGYKHQDRRDRKLAWGCDVVVVVVRVVGVEEMGSGDGALSPCRLRKPRETKGK